jgi:UDP-N-acetylglucosamine--N-acetylmuramyl-(pentapeptide) pyrophosphoryl-undecaprenol N-acetylglucosamine transferase
VIVVTGGGTGGHLEVARLLRDGFGRRGVPSVFIGTTRGQDRRWFPTDDGFAVRYFLDTRGVVDRGPAARLASLVLILRATATALRLLRRHAAQAVVNVGSYAAAPASFAAVLRRTPLFIHEPSARVSPLSRLLRPYAAGVFSSYEAGSPVTAFPVDRRFFDLARPRTEVRRILFLGGSQGARSLNDFALAVAPALRGLGIAIVHQAGEADFARVAAGYQQLHIAADVFPFDRAMARRMAAADLAVSRSGGGTLWELVANGLPTLFVPFPHAARDHQYHNARFFVDRGLAFVARQPDLGLDTLLAAMRADVLAMSLKLMAFNEPDGAEQMADVILQRLAGKTGTPPDGTVAGGGRTTPRKAWP